MSATSSLFFPPFPYLQISVSNMHTVHVHQSLQHVPQHTFYLSHRKPLLCVLVLARFLFQYLPQRAIVQLHYNTCVCATIGIARTTYCFCKVRVGEDGAKLNTILEFLHVVFVVVCRETFHCVHAVPLLYSARTHVSIPTEWITAHFNCIERYSCQGGGDLLPGARPSGVGVSVAVVGLKKEVFNFSFTTRELRTYHRILPVQLCSRNSICNIGVVVGVVWSVAGQQQLDKTR